MTNPPKNPEIYRASVHLVFLSQWIDSAFAGRDPEVIAWARIAKIMEEGGEVVAAYIGATGQNPRKGVTHSISDVQKELLDVALTALGAYEHLNHDTGLAIEHLLQHIEKVADRAHDHLTSTASNHHDRTHGFCVHGELRGDCDRGGY
jgi:NTP pyrophosphatase (non-canonical NTP hydrolase)